jgi:hypothetical protein
MSGTVNGFYWTSPPFTGIYDEDGFQRRVLNDITSICEKYPECRVGILDSVQLSRATSAYIQVRPHYVYLCELFCELPGYKQVTPMTFTVPKEYLLAVKLWWDGGNEQAPFDLDIFEYVRQSVT